MRVSFTNIVTLLVSLRSVFVSGISTCPCLSVNNSYIVTRLWNIVSPNVTPTAVIKAFQQGFAPNITRQDGFQEYASSYTGSNTTVFFFNIFKTASQATAAQDSAKAFVASGALNGTIAPDQFYQGALSFWYASKSCVTQSIVDKYLSGRLWQLTSNSTFTTQGVMDYVNAYFVPNITKAPGFLEYGGAALSDNRTMYFYNVFETADGAKLANAAAAQFVATSELNGNMERVVFTEGSVAFDYTCVSNNAPSNATNSTSGSAKAALGLAAAIAMHGASAFFL